jgi:hypothetical protein
MHVRHLPHGRHRRGHFSWATIATAAVVFHNTWVLYQRFLALENNPVQCAGKPPH